MYWSFSKPDYFVEQPNKDTLIIARNKAAAKREFATIVILGNLLWVPLFFVNHNYISITLCIVWPIGFVLLSYRYIAKFARLLKHGETYRFDGKTQAIYYNNELYCRFGQVTQLAYSITHYTDIENNEVRSFCMLPVAADPNKPIKLIAEDFDALSLTMEVSRFIGVDYVLVENKTVVDSLLGTPFYDVFIRKDNYDGFMARYSSYSIDDLKAEIKWERWNRGEAWRAAKETLKQKQDKNVVAIGK